MQTVFQFADASGPIASVASTDAFCLCQTANAQCWLARNYEAHLRFIPVDIADPGAVVGLVEDAPHALAAAQQYAPTLLLAGNTTLQLKLTCTAASGGAAASAVWVAAGWSGAEGKVRAGDEARVVRLARGCVAAAGGKGKTGRKGEQEDEGAGEGDGEGNKEDAGIVVAGSWGAKEQQGSGDAAVLALRTTEGKGGHALLAPLAVLETPQAQLLNACHAVFAMSQNVGKGAHHTTTTTTTTTVVVRLLNNRRPVNVQAIVSPTSTS